MPDLDDVYMNARTYVDTPWLHQGRTRAGVDCIGLIIANGWDLGIVSRKYDKQNYGRRAHPAEFMDAFYKELIHIEQLSGIRAGHIIIASVGKVLTHCGIIARGTRGYPMLIHADARRKKVVEEPAAVWLNPHTNKGIFSYKGLDQ